MNQHHQPRRPRGRSGMRPSHRRGVVRAAGIALLAMGAFGCGQSADGAAKPQPSVTVTATATVTATETVTPEPTATVTTTETVRTPGPTVTVTKAAAAGTSTSRSSGSAGGNSASGTCSIVSNAGNCYQAGQFCRNSDHGARTTTANITPITCSLRSNSWRWTYS
ncbi:hypothetical protein ACWCRF_13810 [Streptomyces sp. NPDC002405]|uniref:hypothetical protein n=1 Tax=Streptomyces sp. NPDC057596 TaxID=3346178 RepID=UPI0036CDBEC7